MLALENGSFVAEYICFGAASSTYPVVASFNNNTSSNVIRVGVTSSSNAEGIIKDGGMTEGCNTIRGVTGSPT